MSDQGGHLQQAVGNLQAGQADLKAGQDVLRTDVDELQKARDGHDREIEELKKTTFELKKNQKKLEERHEANYNFNVLQHEMAREAVDDLKEKHGVTDERLANLEVFIKEKCPALIEQRVKEADVSMRKHVHESLEAKRVEAERMMKRMIDENDASLTGAINLVVHEIYGQLADLDRKAAAAAAAANDAKAAAVGAAADVKKTRNNLIAGLDGVKVQLSSLEHELKHELRRVKGTGDARYAKMQLELVKAKDERDGLKVRPRALASPPPSRRPRPSTPSSLLRI